MVDFYLISGELGPQEAYEPRACRIRRRLRNTVRGDIALVEVDPAIPTAAYKTDKPLSELLLASKWQGVSLFPVTMWPTPVYVGRLAHPAAPVPENIDDAFVVLDWGLVYPSREQATAALRLRLHR